MLRILLIIYCFIYNNCEAKLNNKVANDLINKYDDWKKAIKRPKNSKAVFHFFYDNKHWPLFNESVTIAERNISKKKILSKNVVSDNDIYKWFKKYPPTTKEGTEAYIGCLENQNKPLAMKFIKQTWVFQNLDGQYLKDFREMYSNYLNDIDDAQKVKNLEAQNNTTNLFIMKDIVENDKTKEYINKILENQGNIHENYNDNIISDPSERYYYVEELINNKEYSKTADILSKYNEGEDKLSLNKKFYEKRRYIAYQMLRAGEPQLAYDVANKCLFKGKMKSEEKARIQWLLGFIAYRFINKIDWAKNHFKKAYENSENAVRISKNAFWLAEVYLSQNDVVAAIDWYRDASQYFHTFYGFLADKRLQSLSSKYMAPIGLSLDNNTHLQLLLLYFLKII